MVKIIESVQSASRLPVADHHHHPGIRSSYPRRDPAVQAHWILRGGFAASALIAGIDKFTGLLADWSIYLAPWLERLVGGPYPYLYVVGAVEILLAIGVSFLPRVFAYVLCAWLLASAFNLLTYPGFYDVALRDIGLALAALALSRLSMLPTLRYR